MTILRGIKSLNGYPPGLYVNEMPVPQSDEVTTNDFVNAFYGEFDRGPVDKYVLAFETPTQRIAELVAPVLGSLTKPNAGSALLDHIDHARIKKAIFVRVIGAGHKTASLTLKDRQATQKDTAIIQPKAGPGTYANIFTAEVQEGTNTDTFKLILTSDIGGKETYDNLSHDPSNVRFAEKVINESSQHFTYKALDSGTANYTEARPAVIAQTQLSGGSNGLAVTDNDRNGSYDPGTGQRTGLKLLEPVGNIVTDVAQINYSSPETDKALIAFGEKYNVSTYTGSNNALTADNCVSYRDQFDTDFGQMVFNYYTSTTGKTISGACLSAIAHVKGNIEDSGIAVECSWIAGAERELDYDDFVTLYNHQIAVFQLKPSAKGDGSLAYRLANDYTLAKTDVEGNIISDNENRKVNRRRLNSWTEKGLEAVAAPWQGKAMTKKMKDDAERRIRTFFDKLVGSKIENYSITFDSTAANIDQFVQNIKVKHYNTAEWVLLNFQGGTNVEVSE